MHVSILYDSRVSYTRFNPSQDSHSMYLSIASRTTNTHSLLILGTNNVQAVCSWRRNIAIIGQVRRRPQNDIRAVPRRRIASLLDKVDCASLLLVGLQRSRDSLPRRQLDGISKLKRPCLASAIGHSLAESLDAVCCAVLGGGDAAGSEEDVEGESVGGSRGGNCHCEECLYIIRLILKIFQ